MAPRRGRQRRTRAQVGARITRAHHQKRVRKVHATPDSILQRLKQANLQVEKWKEFAKPGQQPAQKVHMGDAVLLRLGSPNTPRWLVRSSGIVGFGFSFLERPPAENNRLDGGEPQDISDALFIIEPAGRYDIASRLQALGVDTRAATDDRNVHPVVARLLAELAVENKRNRIIQERDLGQQMKFGDFVQLRLRESRQYLSGTKLPGGEILSVVSGDQPDSSIVLQIIPMFKADKFDEAVLTGRPFGLRVESTGSYIGFSQLPPSPDTPFAGMSLQNTALVASVGSAALFHTALYTSSQETKHQEITLLGGSVVNLRHFESSSYLLVQPNQQVPSAGNLQHELNMTGLWRVEVPVWDCPPGNPVALGKPVLLRHLLTNMYLARSEDGVCLIQYVDTSHPKDWQLLPRTNTGVTHVALDESHAELYICAYPEGNLLAIDVLDGIKMSNPQEQALAAGQSWQLRAVLQEELHQMLLIQQPLKLAEHCLEELRNSTDSFPAFVQRCGDTLTDCYETLVLAVDQGEDPFRFDGEPDHRAQVLLADKGGVDITMEILETVGGLDSPRDKYTGGMDPVCDELILLLYSFLRKMMKGSSSNCQRMQQHREFLDAQLDSSFAVNCYPFSLSSHS